MVKHKKQEIGSEAAKPEWCERIRRLAAAARGAGRWSWGSATIAPSSGRAAAREDLLFTTDLLIEDVHFRRDTHRAEDVGWKALARGLSDIAAMGGEPRFCLVSLALAPWADARWVDGFYRGLLRLARRERTPSGRRRPGAQPRR